MDWTTEVPDIVQVANCLGRLRSERCPIWCLLEMCW